MSRRQGVTRQLRRMVYSGWAAWALCNSACSVLVDADQYSVAQGSLGAGGTASQPGGARGVELPTVRETCTQNPLLQGCDTPGPATTMSPATAPATGTPRASARAEAENILNANCGVCHGSQLTSQQALGGMNYVDDIDQLVEAGKIVPLNSAGSRVIQRIVRGEMPPVSSRQPRMSDADLATLSRYIDDPSNWPEVMPASDCREDGQLVDFDELYRRINADLRSAANDEQPFLRYLSLTNRFTAGECLAALGTDRLALTTLFNLLSLGGTAVTPVAVDGDQTLYRVDLRTLGWDRSITVDGQSLADVWEAVALHNPYAVQFEGDDADDASSDTQTVFPVMFADHVLAAVRGASLYSAIRGLGGPSARQPAALPLTGTDPIAVVSRRFNAEVALAAAAGDLGVTPDLLSDNLDLLDPSLQPLESGTLPRADFTALYVASLCVMSAVLENVPPQAICDTAQAALP